MNFSFFILFYNTFIKIIEKLFYREYFIGFNNINMLKFKSPI